MDFPDSFVEFCLEDKRFISLLPVDSSNDKLVKQLYGVRNTDFKGAFYSMTRPSGQSLLSIKKMIQIREESDNFYYFICHSSSSLLDDEEYIISGLIQAVCMDKYSGVYEIGINMFPDYRGKGIGGKSLDLLISRLCNYFNAYKFITHIFSFNQNSKNLFLSRGFTKCGLLSRHWVGGGIRHDVEVYEFIPSP